MTTALEPQPAPAPAPAGGYAVETVRDATGIRVERAILHVVDHRNIHVAREPQRHRFRGRLWW